MTKPIDDGGPAYPVVAQYDVLAVGLTKREAFAMAAMQGMLASGEVGMTDVVECSIDLADALIAALKGE